MKNRRNVMAAVVFAVLAGTAWAHGGEDHGGEAAPAPPAAVAPRANAQSEEFELVAVLQGEQLTLTLDRFATNEPVADAKIEVESGSVLKANATQVSAGLYALRVPAGVFAKPEKYPLTITVQAGKSSDLLTATLDLTPPPTSAALAKTGNNWAVWRVVFGTLLLAGVALIAVVAMRRRKIKKQSMVKERVK